MSARFVIAAMSVILLASCGLLSQADLQVSAPRTTLRVGETVQLSVRQRQPDGTTRDVTDPTSGTRYYTTGESVLIPELDGRVTCIGTGGKDHESAVIGAANGEKTGSLRFELLPAGPGPGLEVTAEKSVLQEGERVQLHVFKSSPAGVRRELTATSTGTRYLLFAGQAFPDPSVIGVSETGLASAVSSIGSYNYRTVFVFVRNEDSVGWIELKVVHA
jgi:hypothetical protein